MRGGHGPSLPDSRPRSWRGGRAPAPGSSLPCNSFHEGPYHVAPRPVGYCLPQLGEEAPSVALFATQSSVKARPAGLFARPLARKARGFRLFARSPAQGSATRRAFCAAVATKSARPRAFCAVVVAKSADPRARQPTVRALRAKGRAKSPVVGFGPYGRWLRAELSPEGASSADGVVHACARQGACARDGAEEKIVGLGAWRMERTGPCQRELSAGRRACPHPPPRERVQGPGRGDRGTDRGAASIEPRRWSGRPCGRSRGGGGAQTE
jgi:hypothetical protein